MVRDSNRAWGATGAIVLLAALPACHRTFACSDAAQCHLDGRAGFCEASGECSFSDDACASQRRYGDHARREHAGRCVPPDGTAEGESTDPSGAATSSTSGDGSSSTLGEVSSSSSTGGIPGDPCVDGLRDSPPVVASADGQIIEGLRIVSDGEPAISIEGFEGVVVRNCELHHRDDPGLVFRDAHDLEVRNVVVIHDGAPASGPHGDSNQANVVGSDSERVVLEHVRAVRGASGIDLENTPGAQLSFIEVHDVRGPGEAACVRLAESDGALLEDFSCENPLDTARPGDLIEIEASSDCIVRRGMLDGNNAEFGYGVHFTQISGQHHGGLVEDVDAIRMTNGSFSCFPFGRDITFRRTRARENICEIVSAPVPGCSNPGPNGGCIPGSQGLSWAGSVDSINLVIEASAYFALCWNVVWPEDVFMTPPEQLVELDFEMRAPIRTVACWE